MKRKLFGVVLSTLIATPVFAQQAPPSLSRVLVAKMQSQIGSMAVTILTLQAQLEQAQQENAALRTANSKCEQSHPRQVPKETRK